MGTYKEIKKQMNTQSTNLGQIHKKTLGPTGLYELVLVAVHMENFQCTAKMPGTTSTALASFSHDQQHEIGMDKRKGGLVSLVLSLKFQSETKIKAEAFPPAKAFLS